MAYLSKSEIAAKKKALEATPEEQTAWQKAMQIQKAQKFVLRNFLTANMTYFCSWDLYTDPKTSKRIKGGTIFLVLLAMCNHGWCEKSEVWPGDKTLAKMTGLKRSYIQVVKRTMEALGIIDWRGEHKTHTDIYCIQLKKLESFVELARIRITAPKVPTAMDGFVQDLAAEEAQEQANAVADDLEAVEIEDNEDEPLLDPQAPSEPPLCVYCETNRTTLAPDDDKPHEVDGDGYLKVCDKCSIYLAQVNGPPKPNKVNGSSR